MINIDIWFHLRNTRFLQKFLAYIIMYRNNELKCLSFNDWSVSSFENLVFAGLDLFQIDVETVIE